ncbi:MAG: hypothetical protein ABL974_10415, partial [Prosthecobacter sp.]
MKQLILRTFVIHSSSSRSFIWCFSAFVWFIAGHHAFADTRAAMPEKHRALIKEHCVACHGAEKQKGKFRMDELPLEIASIENAEKWQKVLNAM